MRNSDLSPTSDKMISLIRGQLKLRNFAVIAVFVLLFFVFSHVSAISHWFSVTDIFREPVRGKLYFLLVSTVWCAAGLPRQGICFLAGALYGFLGSLWISTAATVAGSLITFVLARFLRLDTVYRFVSGFLSRKKKLYVLRTLRYIEENSFSAILAIKIMPVGSAFVLNVICGAGAVQYRPFLLATFIGSLPQTVLFCMAGAGMTMPESGKEILYLFLFIISVILITRVFIKIKK